MTQLRLSITVKNEYNQGRTQGGAEGAAAPNGQIFLKKRSIFKKKLVFLGKKNGILPPPPKFFSFYPI